jgi:organic hydroperoxide reductase OsmC/OhrA
MEKEHHYTTSLTWTGNKGEGTANYKIYDRDHIIEVKGKPVISGSSDPSFRGSPGRYNPEELFVSSISSCHMLWYLHLCSVNNIVVTDYRDEAKGIMMEKGDGSGYFKEVTLQPIVTLTDSKMTDRARQLHHEANKMCFIANSCNFPIKHEPEFRTPQ